MLLFRALRESAPDLSVAVLAPLAAAGVFPHLLLSFAMLDPILGLVVWRLLRSAPPDAR